VIHTMQALPRRSVSHQSTESYKKLPATVWTQTTCRCTQGILFGRGGLAVPDPAHWMVVLALLLLSWLSPTLRMEASHQGMGSRQLLAPPQLTRLELVGVVHGWISCRAHTLRQYVSEYRNAVYHSEDRCLHKLPRPKSPCHQHRKPLCCEDRGEHSRLKLTQNLGSMVPLRRDPSDEGKGLTKVRAGDGVLASALCVQESHGHTWRERARLGLCVPLEAENKSKLPAELWSLSDNATSIKCMAIACLITVSKEEKILLVGSRTEAMAACFCTRNVETLPILQQPQSVGEPFQPKKCHDDHKRPIAAAFEAT